MSSTNKRYFISAGNIDANRGQVLSNLDKLPLWAQAAYRQGQSFAKPRVYVYKLNRSVGELKSGITVTRLAKIADGTKGLVTVILNGGGIGPDNTMDIPVSRLVRVL